MTLPEKVVHLPFPSFNPDAIQLYADWLEADDYGYANYRSMIQLFDLLKDKQGNKDYRNVFCFGAGYGYELPVLRLRLGQDAKITGIDKKRSHGTREKVHQHMELAQAEYFISGMSEVQGLISSCGVPDMILIRHPGPFMMGNRCRRADSKMEEFQEAITAWSRPVIESNIKMVISMYRHEKQLKKWIMVNILRPTFGNRAVRGYKKDYSTAIAMYEPQSHKRYYPDYWIMTVN